MDRDFDRPHPPEPRTTPRPDTSPALDRLEPEGYQIGRYRYVLTVSQRESLNDVGCFRTVALRDLERFRYEGCGPQMQQDVAALKAQGLVQERHVLVSKSDKLAVLVLTKQGKKLLETVTAAERPPLEGDSTQAYYSGFVKPSEARHDAAIYPMSQAEKSKIEATGGRVRRVVLDYELKRHIYAPLAKVKPTLSREAYAKRQAEVAAQNGLKVTRGKILLPDLRIEYETATGARAAIDLEVATHHYRGSSLRDKALAGFKLYAPADSVSRLAAYDPGLMADILSL